MSSNILFTGQKRSALGWFLYWFRNGGGVTRKHAIALNKLRKKDMEEEEILELKQTIQELGGSGSRHCITTRDHNMNRSGR